MISGYHPEEVGLFTNCVLFCLRAMREMQLPLRGHDIEKICSEHPVLGASVGRAAASAWETLWLQNGNSKSLLDELPNAKMGKVGFKDWPIGPRHYPDATPYIENGVEKKLLW